MGFSNVVNITVYIVKLFLFWGNTFFDYLNFFWIMRCIFSIFSIYRNIHISFTIYWKIKFFNSKFNLPSATNFFTLNTWFSAYSFNAEYNADMELIKKLYSQYNVNESDFNNQFTGINSSVYFTQWDFQSSFSSYHFTKEFRFENILFWV